MRRFVSWMFVLVASALVSAGPILAQSGELGSQTLRGHWHVFIAYALAWVLVLGWVISVFTRMGRLDREIGPE